jgi:hypothetical protein
MPADRVPEFLSGMSRPGDGDWERSVEREEREAGESQAITTTY